MKEKLKYNLPRIILAIWLIIMIVSIGSCAYFSSGNSSDRMRCEVCGKSFTNKDDVNSIYWHNMCENCYSDYQFNKQISEEIQKYNERYGN